MLTAYYSKGCDSSEMFKNFNISRYEDYAKHLNKYNVIHLDIQWCARAAGDYKKTVSYIHHAVVQEIKEYYPEIEVESKALLYNVMSKIYKETGEKFVVIIDEWDTLIRDNSYDETIQNEYIDFLSGMFKGTEPAKCISLAFMTGILPIKRMKTQSTLNNFDEYTMLSPKNFAQKDDILTFLIHLGYLAYNPDRKTVYIPNEEVRQEFVNATKDSRWSELQNFARASVKLLNATLDLEKNVVAEEIEQIHMNYASVMEYNDENSLSCVITIAYLASIEYYFRPVREFPTGRGYTDFVYIPRPEYRNIYPALLIELKWNKNAKTAITQI